MSRQFVIAAIMLVCALLGVLAPVSGAFIEWTGASGVNNNFATAANWSPAQVPGSDDSVLVHSGDSIHITANVLIESLALESTGRDSAAAAFTADSATAFAVSIGSLNVTSGRITFVTAIGIRSACELHDAYVLALSTSVVASNVACSVSGFVTFNSTFLLSGTIRIRPVSTQTGLPSFIESTRGSTHSATAGVVFDPPASAAEGGATFATGVELNSLATIGGTITMTDLSQKFWGRNPSTNTGSISTFTSTATWTNPALSTLEINPDSARRQFFVGTRAIIDFGPGQTNVPTVFTVRYYSRVVLSGGGAVGLTFGVLDLESTLFQLPASNTNTAVYTIQELRSLGGDFFFMSEFGSPAGSTVPPIRVNVDTMLVERRFLLSSVTMAVTRFANLSFPVDLNLVGSFTIAATATAIINRQFSMKQTGDHTDFNLAGQITVTNDTAVPLIGPGSTFADAYVGGTTPFGIPISPLGVLTITGSVTVLAGATITFGARQGVVFGAGSSVNISAPNAVVRVYTSDVSLVSNSVGVFGPGTFTLESYGGMRQAELPPDAPFVIARSPTVGRLILNAQPVDFTSTVAWSVPDLVLLDGASIGVCGATGGVTVTNQTLIADSTDPLVTTRAKFAAIRGVSGCGGNAIVPVSIRTLTIEQDSMRGDRLEIDQTALTVTESGSISSNVRFKRGGQLIVPNSDVIVWIGPVLSSDDPTPIITFDSDPAAPPLAASSVLNHGRMSAGDFYRPVIVRIALGLGGTWRNTGLGTIFIVNRFANVTVLQPACFVVEQSAYTQLYPGRSEPEYNPALCNVPLPTLPSSSSTGVYEVGSSTAGRQPLSSTGDAAVDTDSSSGVDSTGSSHVTGHGSAIGSSAGIVANSGAAVNATANVTTSGSGSGTVPPVGSSSTGAIQVSNSVSTRRPIWFLTASGAVLLFLLFSCFL